MTLGPDGEYVRNPRGKLCYRQVTGASGHRVYIAQEVAGIYYSASQDDKRAEFVAAVCEKRKENHKNAI